jgi:putative transposase
MCLHKGYDYDEVREILEGFGFTAHIRARGEEAQAIEREVVGHKARRWEVERAQSWMNRFRAILTCWEKKAANLLALLHLSCAYITFKQAGLLG